MEGTKRNRIKKGNSESGGESLKIRRWWRRRVDIMKLAAIAEVSGKRENEENGKRENGEKGKKATAAAALIIITTTAAAPVGKRESIIIPPLERKMTITARHPIGPIITAAVEVAAGIGDHNSKFIIGVVVDFFV